MDELIGQECLELTGERYPVLRLTEKGRRLMTDGGAFQVVRRRSARRRRARSGRGGAAGGGEAVGEFDRELFDRLRGVRKRLAGERNVPPYIIFSDRTLQEMSALQPASAEAMRAVTGVGEVKLRRYGEAFLAEIRSFGERPG